LITLIIFTEEYRTRSSFLCSLLQFFPIRVVPMRSMFRTHSSADVSVRTLSSIAAHCDVEDYILIITIIYRLVSW
jgi:hypothetical protein